MIETLEEYQRIMKSTHNMVAGSIQLEATIAALCVVAQSANHLAARGYLRPNLHWRGELFDALEALPRWLLEVEKDPGYFFSGPTDSQGIPLNNPDTEVETTCCKPGSHVFLWTSQEKPNGELPEDTRCDCGRYFVGVSDAEKVDLS